MKFLTDFGVEPILLAAQIVNFSIVLYILKRFLYKPILKVLEDRRKKIETSIRQSEEVQKRFEESSKKQEEILAKARAEASKIIEDAKEEAKLLSEQMQIDAKKSAEETIKRTQETLELEKQKMIADARSQIVDIVALATEKVISKSLQGAEKEKLVQEAIRELEHES